MKEYGPVYFVSLNGKMLVLSMKWARRLIRMNELFSLNTNICRDKSPSYDKHDEMIFSLINENTPGIFTPEFFKIIKAILGPDWKVFCFPKWTIEKSLMNKREVYLGSVDFYIEGIFYKKKRRINLDVAFEFKSHITSFSSVIRQIHAYQEFLTHKNPVLFVVLTYSDVKKWEKLFFMQGIHLIQISKPKDAEASP